MASKIYVHEETTLKFVDTGSSPDALFTCTSLVAANGHQSAYYDLGTAARSRIYAWRAYCRATANPNVGDVVRVYILTSSTLLHPDNDDGSGDIALSSEDKLRNLHHIGNIVCDEVATVEQVASGIIELPHRYVAVVFWNDWDVDFSSTAAHHGFLLTPVPDEIQ